MLTTVEKKIKKFFKRILCVQYRVAANILCKFNTTRKNFVRETDVRRLRVCKPQKQVSNFQKKPTLHLFGVSISLDTIDSTTGGVYPGGLRSVVLRIHREQLLGLLKFAAWKIFCLISQIFVIRIAVADLAAVSFGYSNAISFLYSSMNVKII